MDHGLWTRKLHKNDKEEDFNLHKTDVRTQLTYDTTLQQYIEKGKKVVGQLIRKRRLLSREVIDAL